MVHWKQHEQSSAFLWETLKQHRFRDKVTELTVKKCFAVRKFK